MYANDVSQVMFELYKRADDTLLFTVNMIEPAGAATNGPNSLHIVSSASENHDITRVCLAAAVGKFQAKLAAKVLQAARKMVVVDVLTGNSTVGERFAHEVFHADIDITVNLLQQQAHKYQRMN